MSDRHESGPADRPDAREVADPVRTTGGGNGRRDDPEPSGTESCGPESSGPREPASGGSGPDEVTPEGRAELAELDEQTLRHMLRNVVQDVEPDPEALDRLQRAVPVRRRRRYVLVGVAAAVAVTGLTLPSMVSGGVVPGLAGESSTTAAAGEHTADPSGGAAPNGGAQNRLPERQPGTARPPAGSGSDGPSTHTTPDLGETADSADPRQTLGGVSPTCSRDQLGNAGATAHVPDDAGRISGSFRIVNLSGDSCTVNDPGLLTAEAQGRAQPENIQVLDRTGTEDVPLPPPEQEHDELILRPGEQYQVAFAWVPDAGVDLSGCSAPTVLRSGTGVGTASGGTEPDGGTESDGTGTGTGTDTGVDGGTDTGVDGGGSGSEGGSGTGEDADGGAGGGSSASPESSVLLGYVPGAGEPRTAEVTLQHACAGTVYRTGVLSVG